jgi:hypothetical protein
MEGQASEKELRGARACFGQGENGTLQNDTDMWLVRSSVTVRPD